MSTESTNEDLKRIIGVPGLAATVINFTIGASIYALPGLIDAQLGAAGIIGYVLCGIAFASIIVCYAEIGGRVKTTGGSYAYVDAAFGPFAGFIINWLFFFGWGTISSAAVVNLVADWLTVLFPVFSGSLMRILLLALLVGTMILINVRDSKKSVRFLESITIIKLIPLTGIIIFGFSHVQATNLHWEHLPSIKSFGDTALILFFAFAGFESALNVSGEIKNSRRTVPLGLLFGGLVIFLTYILIQTISRGVLGEQLSEFKEAPLAAVAEKIVGPIGATLLLIASVVSGFGNVCGDVLASPRLLFAGAKDGIFPKMLGKIHPRFATPYLAVITYALLIFAFAVSGGFKQLAILASGSVLLIYLAVILSMIKMRSKKDQGDEKTFRVPGGLTIPIIAITAIIWIFSHLTSQEIISITIFLAVICLMYFVMKKREIK